MAVISVLDKTVSELIAAGEVIERPASVIKELVENSIDAGAKHITVEIKDGGTTFMRIVDDGCGMAAEDVPTAFLRHATSKIADKEDLDTILTLGFRGEALASIAAVARVTVMTKRPEDTYGTRYEIAGADHSEPEECGCPDGTTLVIKDLFFNVPARRKFMKRESAEGNAIFQIIQKIVISHPEVAFRFIRDNKPEFHSDGTGSLLTAIHAVYGRAFAHDLIPVDHAQDDISVKGYALKPLYSKNNRSFQNFFVNGRYVRSKALSVALESAYENLVMTGKFPACVLMLTLPPDTLDVNIHPAKAEVRFSDEKTVINAVYFALKNAMLAAGLIYEFQMPRRDWFAGGQEPVYEQQTLPEPSVQPETIPAAVPMHPVSEYREPVKSFASSTQSPEILPTESMPFGLPEQVQSIPEPAQSIAEPVQKNFTAEDRFKQNHPLPEPAIEIDAEEDKEEFPEYSSSYDPPVPESPPAVAVPEQNLEPFPDVKVVGELFANYILAQSGETFIIIDKHAAHERVIFERLRKANCKQYQQMLLEPCEVLLTMEEFDAMEENAARLDGMGFLCDFSHKPYLKTTAAPYFFNDMNLDEIVQEIAHNLYIGKVDPQSRVLDDTLHELACKSAIKANDRNSIAELQALTEIVCQDEAIRHCPHGRPVMFTMSKYNLEKQFRRRV